MIIAFVEIPLEGQKRETDFVIKQSLAAIRIFRDVKGLQRKYFLNGEHGGGGIYIFDSRDAAEAWFNDGWADWMEGRFGVKPLLSLFDCPVVLDNSADEVRVDGIAVEKPWKAQNDAD